MGPDRPSRQETAKKRLSTRVRSLEWGERLKTLLVGQAGTGKTALARIVAALVEEHWRSQGRVGRYFEILPSQITGKADLDVLIKRLDAGDTVFIDEVHEFQKAVGPEVMFHALADTGVPKYPLSRDEWLELPPSVSWITATTDPGDMDKTTGGALRRRLGMEIRLDAPSQGTLIDILRDRDDELPLDLAVKIAERSGGLPWQALQIQEEVQGLARVEGGGILTDQILEDAFDMMGIDPRGLTAEDRAVLTTLINTEPHRLATRPDVVRYKMSEASLCAASGVDSSTFKKRVQPKLMGMGYLTTVGGQTLTERALKDYAHLQR